MSSLGNLVVNIGANTRDLNKALGQVQREIQTTTGNIQNLGKQMSMAFTAPLAIIGGTAFNTFQNFEQQMAKVKAVSGATSTEFAALKANAEALGASTRFSATEVAALQTEFAKLGFTADEIQNVTEGTLALAQATDSDLAQAAEVAGNVLRAFQLDAQETGRVTDVMAQSFNSTALDMETFALSMKFVAPVAASAGVSLEETTALLGLLADAGIKGSTAGTSLRRIISELGAGSEPVTEKIKQLAAGGLNLTSAMDEVGREAQSALLVLGQNIGKVDGLTTGLQNSAGAAKEMAAIMDDTSQGAMKRMQSAVEGAQIKLGEALAPAVTSVMDKVADLASWFSELAAGNQRLVIAIGAMVAAIGPVLVVLPQMVQGFKMARAAAIAFNSALLANPYIAAAAAIAALGVAVYSLAGQTDIAGRHAEKMSEIYQQVGAEVAVNEAKVKRLASAVEDETKSEEERAAALRELQKLSPEHFANIDMERVKLGELTGAVEKYRASLLNAAKAKVFSQQLEEAIRKQEELKAEAAEGVTVLDRAAAFMQGTTAQFQMAQRLGGEIRATDMLVEELTQKMLELETTTETAAQTTSKAFTPAKTTMTAVATETAKATEAIQLMSMEALQLQELMSAGMGGDLAARGLRQQSTGGDMEFQDIGSYEQDMADAAVVDAEDIELANQYALALDNINARNQTMMELTQTMSTSLGQMFGSMIKGGEEAGEALKGFGKSVLKTMIGVARAHVIASMTNPMNPVNMASGGLAMPLLIAGGLTLVESLLGAIAFADGGIVSGPTLGLVGEYAGARNNPEVIAPLDKLRDIMADSGGGVQNIQVQGVISGNDIELVAERGRNNLRRTR